MARTPATIRVPQSGQREAPASSGRAQPGQATMLASASPMASGGVAVFRRLERRARSGSASMVMVVPFATRIRRVVARESAPRSAGSAA